MYDTHIVFYERDNDLTLCNLKLSYIKKDVPDVKLVDIYSVLPYHQQDYCSKCYGYYFFNFVFASNKEYKNDNLS